MKSFFKRALAAAASSAVALTQLAPALGNVNAADGKTITKELLLHVPIDEESPLKGLVPGDEGLGLPEITRTGKINEVADASLVQHSDWADEIRTYILSEIGDAGSKTKTLSLDKAKKELKKVLKKIKWITDEEADSFIAALDSASGTVTASDFSYAAEIKLDGINKAAGDYFTNKMIEHGHGSLNANGKDYDVDWSAMDKSATIYINGALEDDNTVSYEISVADADGKLYKDAALQNYAMKILEQGVACVKASGAANGENMATFGPNVDKEKAWVLDRIADGKRFVAALQSNGFYYDTPQDSADIFYTDYINMVKGDIDMAAMDESMTSRAKKAIDKAPKSATSALIDSRVTEKVSAAIEKFNDAYGDKITIKVDNITAAEIINSGYDFYGEFEDLLTGKGSFSIADDEADELFEAINNKYADYWASLEEPMKLESVTSHKEIFAQAATTYGYKGFAGFDVIRVIDEIVLVPITTTTTTTESTTESTTTTTVTTTSGTEESISTTTTTTTGTTTTGTTTSDTGSDSTTSSTTTTVSTTSDTGSDSSTSTTTTVSTTSDTGSDSSTSTTTTVSTTSDTGSDSSTSTTTTVSTTSDTGSDSSTSTTTTVSTTSGNGSDSSTSTTTTVSTTSGNGSDSTTSSTTTSVTGVVTGESVTTSTTPPTYVAFEIQGIDAESLVYWSEEKTPIDLSAASVALKIIDGGVVKATVDVSGAFTPKYTVPADMDFPEGVGIETYYDDFVLTDLAAIKKAITDNGYDAEELGETFAEGVTTAGAIRVILVLRGDWNLDGHVDLKDAQACQAYWEAVELNFDDTKGMYESGQVFLSESDYNVLPYAHYAADVFDGDGRLTLRDSMQILNYWDYRDVMFYDDVTWDSPEVVGSPVTPQNILHADPLANDDAAIFPLTEG